MQPEAAFFYATNPRNIQINKHPLNIIILKQDYALAKLIT